MAKGCHSVLEWINWAKQMPCDVGEQTMLKVLIHNRKLIQPFSEPARDLRVQNMPLWLLQRDALAKHCQNELAIDDLAALPTDGQEMIVHADHLYFDQEFIDAFLDMARKKAVPCQAAFSTEDAAFREHVLPLSSSYEKKDGLYLAPLWYYPAGNQQAPVPLQISMLPMEVGYYNVPAYMAGKMGDLVYYLPSRAIIAIDSWVHLFIADIIFGLFARGVRFERKVGKDLGYKLRLIGKAMLQGKQLLRSGSLVRIGKNCTIDPGAVINGPTTIGDNVTIGAGVVIENSIIGNNVNISQGGQVMLSVIGDGVFLPFNAAIFMTTLMERTTVAQNACLQMCVVGRNTFIGAGTTFTDFNLLPVPIRAVDGYGELANANRPVLGCAVGHNCRIGAGLVIYPGRMIASDVVLIGSGERRVIRKNVGIEDSDAPRTRYPSAHKPEYQAGDGTNHAEW